MGNIMRPVVSEQNLATVEVVETVVTLAASSHALKGMTPTEAREVAAVLCDAAAQAELNARAGVA